jgi:hypothetical protein
MFLLNFYTEDFEYVMVPLWLLIVYTFAVIFRSTFYKNTPYYRYFMPALTLKIIGGVGVGLIYQYYYTWGDTMHYFMSASHINVILLENFEDGMYLLQYGGSRLDYKMWQIVQKYRYIGYLGDPNAFMVARLMVIPAFLTLNSYYASSIIVSAVSFVGIWALFRIYCTIYPALIRQFAVAIFYIPSVFFWGSGILKDPITLSALGLIAYSFFSIFILKKYIFLNTLSILLSGYIIYKIKSYIILSFIPFLLIWIGLETRDTIRHGLIRFILAPLLVFFSGFFGFLAIRALGQSDARFSLENFLQTAVEVKKDLNQSYYYSDGVGSSYDIGEFDPTLTGMLSKFPISVFTALFRPLPHEVRNPIMALSAIENLFVLLLLVLMFRKVNLIAIGFAVSRSPFLIFSLGYSLSFAFMVGLTSGNFGNLVRYKIPAVPFFMCALYIIHSVYIRDSEYMVRKKWEKRRLQMMSTHRADLKPPPSAPPTPRPAPPPIPSFKIGEFKQADAG